jgi:hypothetical protein
MDARLEPMDARMEPMSAAASGRSTPAFSGFESPGLARMSRSSAAGSARTRRSSGYAAPASARVSGSSTGSRMRRRSATDAEDALRAATWTLGLQAAAASEDDAALAAASEALLQARFQAAVATQISYSDLVRALAARCTHPMGPEALFGSIICVASPSADVAASLAARSRRGFTSCSRRRGQAPPRSARFTRRSLLF